jgi:hypothetical protein
MIFLVPLLTDLTSSMSGMTMIKYNDLQFDRQLGQGNFGVVNLVFLNGINK